MSRKTGNSGRRYAAAFRQQMVDLVRGGRTPEDLSREFEPSVQSIRTWVAQADREEGWRPDDGTREERKELREWRHRALAAEEELDFLKERRPGLLGRP